jgi:hypothetical protein
MGAEPDVFKPKNGDAKLLSWLAGAGLAIGAMRLF